MFGSVKTGGNFGSDKISRYQSRPGMHNLATRGRVRVGVRVRVRVRIRVRVSDTKGYVTLRLGFDTLLSHPGTEYIHISSRRRQHRNWTFELGLE